MDIHIFFPIIQRFKHPEYIDNQTFKRCLQILSNHSKANELEISINWFSSEKSKVLNDVKKEGTLLVNEEELLENYFEEKKDKVTSVLNSLLGGA